MNRSWRAWGVVLAVGLLAASLFFLLQVRGSLLRKAKPSVTLPDGTVLRVEALTIGTNHSFGTEPALLQRLRNYLPSALQSLLGTPGYVASVSTAEDTAYLWLSQFDPATDTYRDVEVSNLEVFDEAGQAFYVGMSSTGGGPAFKERHLRLDFVPRRADRFRISFQTQGKTFELEVPMPPGRPPSPVWSPQALPQSRQTNGFTFTLTGFRVDTWQTNRHHVRPLFEIVQDGVDRKAWWDPSPEFVDATGNRSRDSLSLLEQAWKIETHFFPSGQFPFPPPTIRSLGKVPAPGPGQCTLFHLDKTLRDQGLVFAAVTGPGRYTISDGKVKSAEPWDEKMKSLGSSSIGGNTWSRSFAEKDWRCLLVLSGPLQGTSLLTSFRQKDRRLLVRARLPQGGYVVGTSTGASTSEGSTLVRQEDFTLAIENMPGELEFELIPLTSTFLEFLTAPPGP